MEFAKPDSLLFRSHYVQARRKKRKSGAPVAPPVSTLLASYTSSTGNVYAGTTAPATPPVSGFNWEPVVDAQGVITDASWQSLQVATQQDPVIYKVSGIDPVSEIETELIANGWDPAQKDYGTGRVRGTFTAWTGLAFDLPNHRAWMLGTGGHHDSSCNGVWRFDINKMQFNIEEMPSDPDAVGFEWTAEYRDKAINTSFSRYYIDANNRPFELPDGSQPSQHNYAGTAYIGGKLINTRNRRYEFDLATRQWSVGVWQFNSADYRPDTYNYVFQYNGNLYGTLRQAGEYGGWRKITQADPLNVQTLFASTGLTFNGEHVMTQMDATRVLVIDADDEYRIFHMDTETFDALTPTTGAPSITYANDCQGLVYIPQWGANGVVIREYTDDGIEGDRYLLDLATNTFTPFNFTGADITNGRKIGNKMFRHQIGGIDCVIYVLVNSTESAVYVMRIG